MLRETLCEIMWYGIVRDHGTMKIIAKHDAKFVIDTTLARISGIQSVYCLKKNNEKLSSEKYDPSMLAEYLDNDTIKYIKIITKLSDYIIMRDNYSSDHKYIVQEYKAYNEII